MTVATMPDLTELFGKLSARVEAETAKRNLTPTVVEAPVKEEIADYRREYLQVLQQKDRYTQRVMLLRAQEQQAKARLDAATVAYQDVVDEVFKFRAAAIRLDAKFEKAMNEYNLCLAAVNMIEGAIQAVEMIRNER